MKRTLSNTERKVRIVLDHSSRDGWSAVAAVDDTLGFDRLRGVSAQDALAKMRVLIEDSGSLDDRPVPLPEKDYDLLCSLLRGIAETWGTTNLPNWREDEYLRGQLELVIETCRVVTDEEYERGDVDTGMQRDRITDWIQQEVWK